MRRRALCGLALLVVSGCAGVPARDASGPAATVSTASGTPRPSTTGPVDDVAASGSLPCTGSIDGDPPPARYEVVLGVVALPSSPGSPGLQAADSGGGPGVPALFAKTGLVVRAGAQLELEAVAPDGARVGIGWGGGPSVPSRSFLVPACPDQRHTGWLAFPGGYWADRPLCLPLVVRAADQGRRVQIGIGKPCPGQGPPPAP